MLRHWIPASIFVALSFGSLFPIMVAGTSDQSKLSCPTGTYRNPGTTTTAPEPEPNGRCLPCSQCGPGLYVAHPCHHTRDTVCDSCHTYRGPHNRDFKRRCRLLFNADDVTRSIIWRRMMTSSDTGTLSQGTENIGYDDNNYRTTISESKSNTGVNLFPVSSAKIYEHNETSVILLKSSSSDLRLIHVNSTADSTVVPSSGDYWWLRLAVNVLSVLLCAALCYFAFSVYRLKRSPNKGYKVISKVEDV